MSRWLRFNLVGALGLVLQLLVVALLARTTAWPAALCAAIAVAITVSHNFVWHVHYTWPITSGNHRARRLARKWVLFNAGNGAISIAGNALVTAALSAIGWHVVLASAAGVAVTSLINFAVCDRLIFADGCPRHLRPQQAARP